MRPEAPTRSDRLALAVVSGPVGHLVGAVLELAAALRPVLVARVRARVGHAAGRAPRPGG